MRALRIAIAIALSLALLPAAGAQAGTTLTGTSPDTLRQEVDSGAYAKSVAAAFARARKLLEAELKHEVRKPALVLDIDETALSNMGCLEAAGFQLTGLGTCVAGGQSTAVPGASALIKLAQRHHVAIFFITGAPEVLCDGRAANLRQAGIGGRFSLICKPVDETDDSVVPYKSGARAGIEKRGYTILLNVGDQRSDLDGGHARKTVLIPNPVYVIS